MRPAHVNLAAVAAAQPGNRLRFNLFADVAAIGEVEEIEQPDVLFDWVPTGVPIGSANQAHNAMTINNTAYTIANFRASRVLSAPVGWV